MITIENNPNCTVIEDDAFEVTNVANTSSSFPIAQFTNLSLQMIFTGVGAAPQAVVKIQISNNGTNWDDMLNSSYTTVGATDTKTIIFSNMCTRYVRVKTSTASNTGTCKCYVVSNGRA